MTDPINRNYTAWYCGDITRQQAEDILRREDLPRISNNFCDRNVFLLRHASKFEKDGVPPFSQYVLSCRFNNNHCDHYRIFYHRTALTGYPASAIGFYIETSQNHHSGHDFIGNTEELEENLKMGQIELQIKDPVTGEQNKRPMKCFPITRTYDMPVAPEKNNHNNNNNQKNVLQNTQSFGLPRGNSERIGGYGLSKGIGGNRRSFNNNSMFEGFLKKKVNFYGVQSSFLDENFA